MNSLHILRILVGGRAASGYRRIGYLIVTVAVAAAAWLTLSAMTVPFVGGGMRSANSGITVQNGMPGAMGLPVRYAQRIENIPGARDVWWSMFRIVKCRESPVVGVALFGYGGSGAKYALVHQGDDERPIHPMILARWQADPLGVLITSKTATACGWRIGQSVQPPEMRGAQAVLLHVVGIVPGTRVAAFAHFDYINRIGSVLFGKNKVFFVKAHADTLRDSERLAARIEVAFAHDYPTVKATTNATVQNASARFGKVQQLLALVAAAVLLCAASVLVSMFAHAAMQRRSRFALLRVFGFGRMTIFAAVVLEGLLVIVVGAALGTALGLLSVHFLAGSTTVSRMFAGSDLDPPSWAYRWMVPWLAGLFAGALVTPAMVIRGVRAAGYSAG